MGVFSISSLFEELLELGGVSINVLLGPMQLDNGSINFVVKRKCNWEWCERIW